MENDVKTWDPRSIPQRYLVSFFSSTFNDDPQFIVQSADTKNKQLNYYNVASSSVDIESQICAALCMAYMENQGLTLHKGKVRSDCYTVLVNYFSSGENLVIGVVGIIDDFYKFSWENE